MIALRTFLSSFNNTNHEMAISVLKEGLLRSRNLVGKVISRFSQLFVGDKDDILSENSLFSQCSTVCAIDIFVFLKSCFILQVLLMIIFLK